ncbi:hypothetical protein KKD52_06885 [Myxococcota bacterium]|jgi:hypothetical protein|nr:hypothetical protein [Myxococcota bacterium]MBU1411052.1 hypothetical protein [Myxococcota bacterium]MBU1510070.1 hypothetical protein [Myxococcota bacterium]PKN24173.1 MAG: hypothetical protein CVU65_12545 [Deltaproteobacteria bacterium HGW-Deltaproteobacteria-22]
MRGLACGLLILLSMFLAAPAGAQNISLSLDARAIDEAMNAEYGRSHSLNSMFSLENVTISKITVFAVTATFDLVFSGHVEVPIPFAATRRIRLYQTLALQASFVPTFDGRKIEIPVRSITISYQDSVKMSLGSHALTILVAFKRWLFSDQGRGLLERRLSISLESQLSSWFGKRAFTGKVLLAQDRLTLQLVPKP